jgi:hypothetical protein
MRLAVLFSQQENVASDILILDRVFSGSRDAASQLRCAQPAMVQIDAMVGIVQPASQPHSQPHSDLNSHDIRSGPHLA